jgi:hypothetical protein
MTRKVYKSAMGKAVDLGSLILQNEGVRAVGNMNVNARGDLLDSGNRVIDQKNRQVQRQYQRTTNVSDSTPVHTSTRSAKLSAVTTASADTASVNVEEANEILGLDTAPNDIEPIVTPEPLPENTFGPTGEGGLAAAIARSRLIKQEKEKTLREKAREQQIRKI